MTHPETASFSEFAAIYGCKPGYVTQLRKEGRLVLTDNGKRVRVEASLARIAASKDPAMQVVADRHAANRGATLAAAATAPPAAPPESGADKIGNSYQAARAVKERYLAMAAKRDYEISVGKLLDADAVRDASASAVTLLRTRLESIADQFDPPIRTTVAEAIEHALADLASDFSAIAKDTDHP